MCEGDVVNVSGWRDEDKEGGHYRDYFGGARSYSVTNFGGYRGESVATDHWIDLEAPLSNELDAAFDVVLNHTTLEHVFDVFTAVNNLCRLSRDLVIVVVPFIQEQHESDSFSDYWRFTPQGLNALFKANNLETVLLCSNQGTRAAVYHLAVASRRPELWRERLNELNLRSNDGGDFFRRRIPHYARRILGL